MTPPRIPVVVLALALSTLFLHSPLAAVHVAVEGVATFAWGDPSDPLRGGGPVRMTVRDDAGFDHVFTLPAGGAGFQPGAAQGARVRVVFDEAAGEGGEPLVVIFLGEAPPGALAVTGHQPWVSLLCKFSNIATEPKPVSYFTGMYANSPGRLDHYWREASYDQIDVVGSTATSSWLVLPHNQTFYVPTPGSGCGGPNGAHLDALFDDCTAVANPFIDFSLGGTGGFVGINLMFNGDLDGCAWGGGKWATLDGVSKTWRTTWEPPWGYQNVSVMGHEMGHGFGMPHSNNWDNDGNPYDNSWDVMSDAWGYEGNDPTYGTMPKHPIAYQKDLVGWYPAEQVFTPPGDGIYPIELADVALPNPVDGYRLIELPIPSLPGRWWTVETRRRNGIYDAHLPGEAVVVHQVDPNRGEPPWCYDFAVPPDGEADGESTMYRPGEVFASPTEAMFVSVDRTTADGFAVTVWAGSGLIFLDTFELGNTSRWSALVIE